MQKHAQLQGAYSSSEDKRESSGDSIGQILEDEDGNLYLETKSGHLVPYEG